jgi:hypothetical protein
MSMILLEPAKKSLTSLWEIKRRTISLTGFSEITDSQIAPQAQVAEKTTLRKLHGNRKNHSQPYESVVADGDQLTRTINH